MDSKKGFIYKIKNIQTGKIYIGQAREFKKKNNIPYNYGIKGRWNDHVSSSKTLSTPLAIDIRKYGKDSFELDELCKENLNDLDALEANYIQLLQSFVPNGYNVMRHSQNKHRDKSNIVSHFRGQVVSAVLRKIRRNTIYTLVYCYLELQDGSKRRIIFGQNSNKTFQDVWDDAVSFAEELDVPIEENTSNSDDLFERYSSKLQEFSNSDITKIRITNASNLIAVYITTSDMTSWKEQKRICFGGKHISKEIAYFTACEFIEALPKKDTTVILDSIQSLQQVAASKVESEL
jgi:hypothetical protein